MNSREYIKKFVNSFTLILVFSYILSINLVYPKFSIISIGIQLSFISAYIFFFHILLHKLPNVSLNYHMYSHHNKNLKIPRWLELIGEFICDVSFAIPLIALKYFFNIPYLSYTLILFIIIWYSTGHVINQSLIYSSEPNSEHKVHHTEQIYNFGPAYMDMIFGTLKSYKYEIMVYEINNGIILFLLFYVASNVGHFSLQV